VATVRLYRFLKSHRVLDAMAVWVSRRVRESPPSSLLNAVLGPLRARFRGEMQVTDILGVVDALDAEGVRYWIAGGWGVDLLYGSPTRRHDDLDILLADYNVDESRARGALESMGYRQIEVLDGTWMTPRNLLDDGFGHQIELLGIDWDELNTALGYSGPSIVSSSPIKDRDSELLTTGTLLGRQVPCLSAQLQLFFHKGFPLRGVDGPDIELLQAKANLEKQRSGQR